MFIDTLLGLFRRCAKLAMWMATYVRLNGQLHILDRTI